MSEAVIRVQDGEGGQVNVICEYRPGYDMNIPSHGIVAELQSYLATNIMRGAVASDAVEISADVMEELKRDFPDGWTIEQAAEYQRRSVKLALPTT